MLRLIVLLFGSGLLLSLPIRGVAQQLTVCIEGIRNHEGEIRLAFYRNDEEFKTDTPFRIEIVKKDTLTLTKPCLQFSGLEKGVYGLALLDDENNNGKLDYKLLVPDEGFGFSDYYPEKLVRPAFEDFDFYFDGKEKTVAITLRYILYLNP